MWRDFVVCRKIYIQIDDQVLGEPERRGIEDMRREKLTFIPFRPSGIRRMAVLFLLVGMVFTAGCKEEVVGPSGVVGVGEPAIDFNLPNQYGGTTTMSDYRGQVILLTLSALWCVPCREEAEEAEAFYQEYVGQGFITLEVLVDDDVIGGDRATVEQAAEWADEYGITFPVLADTQGTVDQIYGMGALPVNVVIDRGFVVRYIFIGYDEEEIRAAVESLL